MSARRFLQVLVIAVLATATVARAQETAVPRIIVGLFNGADEQSYRRARIHIRAEMPLNHLGLVVLPFDVRHGLPPDSVMREARGILTWFSDAAVPDAAAYVRWLDAQQAQGKRLVVLGHPGFDPGALSRLDTGAVFERVMDRIGVRWLGEFTRFPYMLRIVAKDVPMIEFERPLAPVLPPYHRMRLSSARATSHLSVRVAGESEPDHVVVTSPGGGYGASDYMVFGLAEHADERAWIVDPFRFFSRAFATDGLPKPDTTTLSGRRMYYSHVDGDGWHNVSLVDKYRARQATSAEVMYEELILPYPDLPVTIAPITGDLDPAWYGMPEAVELARRIFALDHVEAGTHTHSHPFAWAFFRDPNPRREIPFLGAYPPRPGRGLGDSVWTSPGSAPAAQPGDGGLIVYDRPRSYAVKPFSLELEVAGSIERLEPLLPPGKRVEILQWSGDTSPFEAVFGLLAAAKVRNVNGGDPRMDGIFDSYAWLSPLAVRIGPYWQVYSSGSNENIYTNNWRGRFYAFRNLVDTFRNSETPVRVKPMNIYYHIYSAERPEGLAAVRHNLDYVRSQETAPVATSNFAAMVEGFLDARVTRLGDNRWRIDNRGVLETIRFDHAALLAVDFARSEGVIGQRHHQGSLYVALDAKVAAPVIALRAYDRPDRDPEATVPYLVSARWRVAGLTRNADAWRFRAHGFGRGEFRWKTPGTGSYEIVATAGARREQSIARADAEGVLEFVVRLDGIAGVDIDVRRLGAAP